MRHHTRHGRRLAILAALLTAAAPAAAQTDDLPAPDGLIERYVEAIGGRERVLAAGSSRTVGTFSMPAMGMEGRMEVLAAPPNLIRVRMEMPMGTIENGFDGEVAWAISPMGAQVLEGAELQAASEEANALAAVRDRSLFESIETIERTEMNGEACYKVEFIWKSGNTMQDCYSIETGLLVASTLSRTSPQGDFELEQHYSDYREFDGFILPMRVEQHMMGQDQVMTIDTFTIGPVPDSAFALPAEIRNQLSGSER